MSLVGRAFPSHTVGMNDATGTHHPRSTRDNLGSTKEVIEDFAEFAKGAARSSHALAGVQSWRPA